MCCVSGEYVSLIVEDFVIGRAREGVSFLLQGLMDVVPKSVLRGGDREAKLSALDLELIICGMPVIDCENWESHSKGNLSEHPHLYKWFWQVVGAMDVESQAKVLAFACGNSRLPANGFKGLRPAFTINVTAEPCANLPTSHTCINTLQLPKYTFEAQLRARLMKVIELDSGFGFI